ncbi:ABC transporter ATP-binding protein [Streptomyces sp. ODS05-4]|uniref:ABC transporter ATP-binding protein n=1 Tax=Streptomyces sp. ODS05-4 TaxID=2944939 RepID=UPI00210E1B10|nr:ABC transporter ATP-binding protein [Streptomyces sp. ODS05-4]
MAAPDAPASDVPPKERPEPTAPRVWRVLSGYVRPYRYHLLAGCVLGLATAAAGLALPLAAKRLVDGLAEGRPISGDVFFMAALLLATATIGPAGNYLLRRTAESVVLDARRRLTSRLLRLTIEAADRSEPGDLMARVTSDTTLLRQITTESLVGSVTGVLTLGATLTVMALLDPVLLAVTLTVLCCAGVLLRLLAPRIKRASQDAQAAVGRMGSALERSLGALRTIKAAGAEAAEERVVHQAAADSWQASVRAAKWLVGAAQIAELALQTAFFIVLAVGGARAASGAIGLGTLIAFLMYVFSLISPIQQMVSAFSDYQVGAAAIARIQEAERLPTEPAADHVPPVASDALPARLEFQQVGFRYATGGAPAHREVTFTVPRGGLTAFVGPSGAGKSTVFSLIERFYTPDAGRILLEGVDLDQWEIPALRAAIGYVEQDAPVLSGTLRENLLLGAPDSARLRQILRVTRLEDLVARLPEGLDTPLGHRGSRLSGGERQRVAIARALLRRPRLLLLDEATSQLDAVNEAALRDTVAEVSRTTTVLVIAHRLSTVTSADRIVVMAEGAVRAIGTHAELVRSDALYAQLSATQFLSPPTTPSRPGELSPDAGDPSGGARP